MGKTAKELLVKYRNGVCTPEEKVLIESWYHQLKDDTVLDEQRIDAAGHAIWKNLPVYTEIPAKRVALWPRFAAAASVLLLLSTGLYLYISKKEDNRVNTVVAMKSKSTDSHKVILTLSNGKQISLSDANNGKLADQGGITITKTAEGEIAYSVVPAKAGDRSLLNPEGMAGNTISTPRGETYTINLPDGTKVTLNAASTFKFPSTFANLKERRVELEGEAYFEVKHNAKQPFRVQSGGQVIEDIGTSFNVNSYRDERAIETTLIEGAARVSLLSGQNPSSLIHSPSYILKPGQKSTLVGQNLNVSTADLQKVTAWKNGEFFFKDDDLSSILRQVSRWYNVAVVYQGSVPVSKFTGQASRKITLAEMIEIIRASGVEVNLKNKTLFIEASK